MRIGIGQKKRERKQIGRHGETAVLLNKKIIYFTWCLSLKHTVSTLHFL